tara:strand:- start:237 stop:458 length:222 start_codon:yes stop_codon:yes gene_type:complete
MTRDQYITFKNTGQGAELLFEYFTERSDLALPYPVFATALQQAIRMGRLDFRKIEIELQINAVTKDGNIIKYY